MLDRKYDTRLRLPAIADGDLLPIDQIEQLTRKQRLAMYARIEAVNRYRQAVAQHTAPKKRWMSALLAELRRDIPELKISERTLQRWHDVYATAADCLKLTDRRGGGKKAGGDQASWDYFRDIYLDQRQPTKHLCWQRTQEWSQAGGAAWCGYDSMLRQLSKRIAPEVQARYRTPVDYRNHFSPYVEMDPDAWPAGVCWVGDHRQLDVWVRYGKSIIRPWVTAWMDWRTWKIVGWVLCELPHGATILSAFRHGIMDESNAGGPDVVYIDNGKDYDGWQFHGQTKQQRRRRFLAAGYFDDRKFKGIYNELRIDVIHAIPHNAKAKRIERWFGFMSENFDKTFDTYAGRSTDTRPEELKAILKSGHRIPTFEAVESEFGDFIRVYNAKEKRSEHMDGLSPDAFYQQHCPRVRAFDNGLLDMMLQHWHDPVRVGRNGITIRPKGKSVSYGQNNAALMPYKTRRASNDMKVLVSYDPHDLRKIRVFRLNGSLITEAVENTRGMAAEKWGVSDLSKVIADQRSYRKATKVTRKHHERSYLSVAQQAADKARENRPARPDGPPRLVPTRFDGQSQALENQQQIDREWLDEEIEPLDLSHMADSYPDVYDDDEDLLELMSPAELNQRYSDQSDDVPAMAGDVFEFTEDDDEPHLLDEMNDERAAS